MSQCLPFADKGRHQCDNCQKIWPASKLKDIVDLEQRLDSGGTVPSGECPDCGCFCYPYESKRQKETRKKRAATTLKKELARDIRHAIMEMLNEECGVAGCNALVDSKLDKILLKMLP